MATEEFCASCGDGEIFFSLWRVLGGGGFYGEFSEGGETENRLSDSNLIRCQWKNVFGFR